jgi:hypothetical protein
MAQGVRVPAAVVIERRQAAYSFQCDLRFKPTMRAKKATKANTNTTLSFWGWDAWASDARRRDRG